MDGRDPQVATDARLTIAASQGDDDAFAVLYERYAPRITGYLTRLVGDEHLAQDLTHEVFVSALRRLRISRPPIAFGPWLYRIARNASIDVHRRSQLVRQVSLDGSAEDGVVLPGEDGPETVAELRQWLDDLRDLLGSLSETHRSVLVLREFEGLSNSEIGKRLGVSRPAVEGLLFRARAKMRSEYDDLVSGRRCETVQQSLTRAGAGRRLPIREHDLAARHLRACVQCRRHAWEEGVAGLFDERDRRSALLPVPAAVAALLARLSSRLQHLGRAADPSTTLAISWGRAAAAATLLAVAGGSIVPAVRDRAGDVLSPSSHAAPARVAAAPAQLRIARSPAAAPTGAPARAAARPGAPV